MMEIENDPNGRCYSNLAFLRENDFQKDEAANSPKNWLWTLKMPYFYQLVWKCEWHWGKNKNVGMINTQSCSLGWMSNPLLQFYPDSIRGWSSILSRHRIDLDKC